MYLIRKKVDLKSFDLFVAIFDPTGHCYSYNYSYFLILFIYNFGVKIHILYKLLLTYILTFCTRIPSTDHGTSWLKLLLLLFYNNIVILTTFACNLFAKVDFECLNCRASLIVSTFICPFVRSINFSVLLRLIYRKCTVFLLFYVFNKLIALSRTVWVRNSKKLTSNNSVGNWILVNKLINKTI